MAEMNHHRDAPERILKWVAKGGGAIFWNPNPDVASTAKRICQQRQEKELATAKGMAKNATKRKGKGKATTSQTTTSFVVVEFRLWLVVNVLL